MLVVTQHEEQMLPPSEAPVNIGWKSQWLLLTSWRVYTKSVHLPASLFWTIITFQICFHLSFFPHVCICCFKIQRKESEEYTFIYVYITWDFILSCLLLLNYFSRTLRLIEKMKNSNFNGRTKASKQPRYNSFCLWYIAECKRNE